MNAPMLNYLAELRDNNAREWYHLHREGYREANAQFEALLEALILGIGAADPSILHNVPGEITFKLARDTRFSRDKSPYNPAFRAHIGPRGKLPIPVGYYIMIKPGDQSFLGGGLFTGMFKDATAMVRDAIARSPEEWEAILRAEDFRRRFALRGEVLKNVPRGYPREHPQAQYLKHKSWYVEHPVTDAQLLDAERFLPEAIEVFTAMKPLNDFLNRALEGFQMPAR